MQPAVLVRSGDCSVIYLFYEISILGLIMLTALTVAVWRSGSALVPIDLINVRRARLVLGWVTVRGFKSRAHPPGG